MEPQPQNQTVLVLHILYVMLFVNKLIYGAVIYMMGKEFVFFPELDIVGYVFIAMSVLCAIGSFYLMPMILRPHIQKMQAEFLNSQNLDALKTRANQVYLSAFIIRSAVTEAITIFGLVLALIGTDGLIYVPFALASILLLIIQRPNVEKDLLEKVQGNSAPSMMG